MIGDPRTDGGAMIVTSKGGRRKKKKSKKVKGSVKPGTAVPDERVTSKGG